MFKEEILYNHSSVLIVIVLFALILLANEAGYWFARRFIKKSDDGIKSQTNAIQAGMLGLLALLMGFSFSMALQRFDGRSAATIEESNAIGTAYLRIGLLPEPQAAQMYSLLSSYVDLRVEGGRVDLSENAVREAVTAKTLNLQSQLWKVAVEAAEADPRPVTSGLFIQSLNEVIDAYGRRQAALDKHVPEVVLFLLFVIFIVSGSILGYASGLGGRRPWLATVSMAGLIALIIFVVIDLDRPRRGLIEIDQSSMTGLKQQIDNEAGK